MIQPTVPEDLREAFARMRAMTPEQTRRQLISLAFGNLKLSDDRVTREDIERAFERIDKDR
jgi:hypothetical protein